MAEEIRRSQLITTYGIGAISDLKDFSGVLKSPNVWEPLTINRLKKEEKVEDPRLAKALGVDYFLMPPKKQEKNSGWLPFTLFPRMLHCPRCKSLQDVHTWFPNGIPQYPKEGDFRPWDLYCKCGGFKSGKQIKTKLIPSRFVTICPSGHLDDFPYYEWVHNYDTCSGHDKPRRFKLRTSGGGASLSDIWIQCEYCKASKSMSGALDADIHQKVADQNNYSCGCKGNRPEMYSVSPKFENCNATLKDLRFVLRNASNIHFPKIYTSLLIPPYSKIIYEEFQADSRFDEYREALRNDNVNINEIKEDLYRWARRKFNLTDTEISGILSDLLDKDKEYDLEKYKYDEFCAFINFDQIENSSNFIVTRRPHEAISKYHVNCLLKCDRIREIKAFAGFSRIKPYSDDFVSEQHIENNSQKLFKLVRACNKELNWLPGVEFFGEGIFISFSGLENITNDHILKRINALNSNVKEFNLESGFKFNTVNARFVALHTLSHFIIKRISFESGYTLASMKERIFCNIHHEDLSMNAILIYIADTDSVGTLGGLCRLADHNKLKAIFSDIFEESEWCSSDPVCRESSGQGMGSLNLAACHSCCLLPETCCEYGNRFLDRTLMELFFDI